jgi:hypothetical protein
LCDKHSVFEVEAARVLPNILEGEKSSQNIHERNITDIEGSPSDSKQKEQKGEGGKRELNQGGWKTKTLSWMSSLICWAILLASGS